MRPAGPPAARRAARTTSRARAVSTAVAASFVALLGVPGCSGADVPRDDPAVDRPAAAPSTSPSPAAPTPAPAEPLVTATPDVHSQVGDLVAGFPEDLLPLPPDAVVLVTSAVPVGDAEVQEVSLNLRTATSVQDVVALYRTALTTAGFTEVPPAGPATDLAAEVTFVRSGGDELVSIGVLDDGTARTVTVGGRVRTAA
ncbi:hypothetical protein ICW40_19870 [Actinotalea ferrariae]|uniref:hypothetical protein n=1 Tax=Actinotalea ferrariae TaxID=1386098 RepID=UPI001C8C9BE1|nr:hypothetical protein [Actinotalea ferrariae]MBX9247052.1 hypothetical protein [Actinotalea ferrariae]